MQTITAKTPWEKYMGDVPMQPTSLLCVGFAELPLEFSALIHG